MGVDVRFEAVCKYSDEGITQAKEVVNYLKKRQAIELDYAKSLQKLAKSYLPDTKRVSRKSTDAPLDRKSCASKRDCFFSLPRWLTCRRNISGRSSLWAERRSGWLTWTFWRRCGLMTMFFFSSFPLTLFGLDVERGGDA